MHGSGLPRDSDPVLQNKPGFRQGRPECLSERKSEWSDHRRDSQPRFHVRAKEIVSMSAKSPRNPDGELQAHAFSLPAKDKVQPAWDRSLLAPVWQLRQYRGMERPSILTHE